MSKERYIPLIVSEIYREVLKIALRGNDLFFSMDTKYHVVNVRGYKGRFTASYNHKPDIDMVGTWDDVQTLAVLLKNLKKIYMEKTNEQQFSDDKEIVENE